MTVLQGGARIDRARDHVARRSHLLIRTVEREQRLHRRAARLPLRRVAAGRGEAEVPAGRDGIGRHGLPPEKDVVAADRDVHRHRRAGVHHLDAVAEAAAPADARLVVRDRRLVLLLLVVVREQVLRPRGPVGLVLRAGEGLDERPGVEEQREVAVRPDLLERREVGVQAEPRPGRLRERHQAPLRQRDGAAPGGVHVVLGRLHRHHHVVRVVPAVQEDAHEGLVVVRRLGIRVHQRQARKRVRCGDGAEALEEVPAEDLEAHGHCSTWYCGDVATR